MAHDVNQEKETRWKRCLVSLCSSSSSSSAPPFTQPRTRHRPAARKPDCRPPDSRQLTAISSNVEERGVRIRYASRNHSHSTPAKPVYGPLSSPHPLSSKQKAPNTPVSIHHTLGPPSPRLASPRSLILIRVASACVGTTTALTAIRVRKCARVAVPQGGVAVHAYRDYRVKQERRE
ncbi:hypothetical protein LZ32DRAFT_128905 [Colletotrichum eremochloae]|nr:hypothetical protein LZ32DRAFT_128905 [Colletotrichum eremochloae]